MHASVFLLRRQESFMEKRQLKDNQLTDQLTGSEKSGIHNNNKLIIA